MDNVIKVDFAAKRVNELAESFIDVLEEFNDEEEMKNLSYYDLAYSLKEEGCPEELIERVAWKIIEITEAA